MVSYTPLWQHPCQPQHLRERHKLRVRSRRRKQTTSHQWLAKLGVPWRVLALDSAEMARIATGRMDARVYRQQDPDFARAADVRLSGEGRMCRQMILNIVLALGTRKKNMFQEGGVGSHVVVETCAAGIDTPNFRWC